MLKSEIIRLLLTRPALRKSQIRQQKYVHRLVLVDYEVQELIKALDRCIAADPNAQGFVLSDLRNRLENSKAELP